MRTLTGLCLVIALAACSAEQRAEQSDRAQDSAEQTRQAGGQDEMSSYGQIDRERLLNIDEEPGQWLTTGRDFGKTHFSPLDQINRDNVEELGFAWEYATGTTRGLEANPIMVDGVLYTSGTTGRVYALNAATGEEIWYFDPRNDGQVNRYTCCDEVNRGVAVWEGMVYVASLDGRLFGLDAANGDVIWEKDTFIYEDRAYTSSGAPEVAGDVVVIGNAGADYDARGYVSAYDLKSGELAWRFFVVPRDPALGQEHPELEMAAETWDPNSRWDVGGGGTPWNGMNYDPELNLLYVGTGNSALFNWNERSPSGGDNLFLASILAINPDTGRLVWHYQQVPKESWDYTATMPMILTDLMWEGEMRKVLMQAPKAGFFYILDRETGELLSADPYVEVNWASHVDLETGRPQINEEMLHYREEPKFVLPSGMGGHNWNPMSWNPVTQLVYIPTIEGGSVTWDPTDGHEYRPRQPNSGNQVLFGNMLLMDPENLEEPMRSALQAVQDSGQHESSATLMAWDPFTGERVWEQEAIGWWDRAGVLSTGGGLVFQGTDSGYFRAYDAENGEQLLDIHVGTSIIAAPMTYTVDGVQYVSLMAGWGGGGWHAPYATSAVLDYGNEGRILAFRLGGGDVPIPDALTDIAPIPEPPVENTASEEEIQRGQQLYARNCNICHSNTDTSLTPDLRRMNNAAHQAFDAIVLQGARRFRGMPQFDDVLDEEETGAIHAYLIDLAWNAWEAEQRGDMPDTHVGPVDGANH